MSTWNLMNKKIEKVKRNKKKKDHKVRTHLFILYFYSSVKEKLRF